MTKKLFKFLGYLLSMQLLFLLIAILSMIVITGEKLDLVYQVAPAAVPIPTDQPSIERGKHLVSAVLFCADCHEDDFGGTVYDEGPLVGRIGVKNLTAGEGGIQNEYQLEDWVRALRHGLGTDSKTLIDMPSQAYSFLSDEDLGAVIAYMLTLKPVDREIPPTRVGPLARIFLLLEPELLPATIIDHDLPPSKAPPSGVTVEYGNYLANSCRICHEQNLAGGSDPGAGLNLTPGGNLGRWSEEQFILTLRSGVTPELKLLDSELMPWPRIAHMTDDELRAVWLFLKSLPPVSLQQKAPKIQG